MILCFQIEADIKGTPSNQLVKSYLNSHFGILNITSVNLEPTNSNKIRAEIDSDLKNFLYNISKDEF